MDLAERLEALKRQNDGPTEEDSKELFLEALTRGVFPHEAAKSAGRTVTWFRHRRSPRSQHYDVDFHMRYDEIMDPDGDFKAALIDQARSWLAKAASDGNVRAIEKILMAYDPDFQFLRPVSAHSEVNIEHFVQLMPGIPTAMLEQIRDALLEAKQKELPVLDA
jgi:hypothetical protein